MELDHYFLGESMLVVTVTHGVLDKMGQVRSRANAYAIERFQTATGDRAISLFLRNYETKKTEDGNVLSIFTYERTKK